MSYCDFLEWLTDNCPAGCEKHDFLEFLAERTATLINVASEKQGVPVSQYVHMLLSGFNVVH